MKTTLPTLSEVVDKVDKLFTAVHDILDIFRFNDFIKQKLELWMFIPCKDGLPLEEPDKYHLFKLGIRLFHLETLDRCKEYQKAKERVIFKVAESITKQSQLPFEIDLLLFEGGHTISDLCNKVELTDNEFKRLGL